MRVLVTGATGGVGRQLVAQLTAAGVEVCASTRRPSRARMPAGVDVIGVDLAYPPSLSPALRDIDRMYLFPVDETAAEVVDMAERAGVRRIVVLSAAAVTIGLHDNVVEDAVERSGMEWTHVRPAEFMTNKLHLWAPSIRAERVVRYPYGHEVGAPVHEADIAAVAVAALLEEGHHGRAYTLTGPERITVRDQVRAIGAALGSEVRFEEVTPAVARRLMRAQGGFAAMHADLLLGYADYDGTPGSSDSGFSEEDFSALTRVWPGVQDAIGRPGRTFAQWAHDHVEDFR